MKAVNHNITAEMCNDFESKNCKKTFWAYELLENINSVIYIKKQDMIWIAVVSQQCQLENAL